ncbi:MAG: Gfo/Idh/MocA family oxidoreductase [Acidobacteria bacterium]|nr:Gfo/Idh/MocA family oxidoreductase [Acidobacteriota bacterium]
MDRRTLLAGAASYQRILGANDRPMLGWIGAGGRGRFLAGEFKEIGFPIPAVCDVYQPNLEAGLKLASPGAKGFQDYRRLLDDKSIDAVVVATPDHWHAPMVIDAVNAGKDVYVEKPLCHTIEEGYRMVDAVRANKRVLQVGTQRRSSPIFIEAKSVIDSGVLGDVRLVTSWWLNHQASLNPAQLQGDLDWKAWLGSAPDRPVDAQRFFNWYYYYDYSGGLIIGQAAHIFDAIQWFMNSKAPLAVTTAGGQLNLKGAEIPDTATVVLEFADNYMANFTLGYKAMRYHSSQDQMKQFHGNKARLDVNREGWWLVPESTTPELKPSRQHVEPGNFARATRDHIRNFLDCIRSRKDPNATVENGLSTAIALVMTMESLRQGRRVRFDATTRQTRV